jgi:hypothetical protein
MWRRVAGVWRWLASQGRGGGVIVAGVGMLIYAVAARDAWAAVAGGTCLTAMAFLLALEFVVRRFRRRDERFD